MSTNKKEKKKSSYEAKKGTKRSRMGCLRWMLWLIHYILDSLVDFIFKFIYDDANRKLLIPVKHSFLVESATGLAEKIRNKELSSEKLVQACIDRIVEVNADLNCVVDSRFQEALAEARSVDQFLESTSLSVDELKRDKPFLGVPFTCKESIQAAGMNHTMGLVSRKGTKASEDSTVVARVKAGGGILLAVTNIPEFIWQESRNNVYGQTNNPYDFHRTAGASSGGCAAAVAACLVPMAVGSDTGGSIRMPCYFCGLFGHMPTTGTISTKGIYFRTGEETDPTMSTAGTLTRYAEDISPMLKLLVGENVDKLKLDTQVNMKQLRLSFVVDFNEMRMSRLNGETRTVLEKAVSYLEERCGTKANKVTLPELSHSYNLWHYWLEREWHTLAYELGNKQYTVSGVRELVKMVLGRSEFTVPTVLKLLESSLLPVTPKQWAEDKTAKLRQTLIEELGDDGVLVLPSFPTTAHQHYVPFFRPFNFCFWAIVNVLHFPATQVPLGLSRDGLPLGLQVVATPYNDHLCIAVAQELENAFGGYVPPCAIVS